MDLLGFLRRRPSAPEPLAGPVFRAPAWPAAAPLQRTVAAPELITAPARFRTELVSWADPSLTGAPAHVVSPEAPSGLGHGLAVPAPPARPDPPAPLQRHAAGAERTWRRFWSRETPVSLQRATSPAASPPAADAPSTGDAPDAPAPSGATWDVESVAVELPRPILPVVAAPPPAPALIRAERAPLPPPVPRPAVPLQRAAGEPPPAPRSVAPEVPVPATPPAAVPPAEEVGARAGVAQAPATVQRTTSPAPTVSRPGGPSTVDPAAPAPPAPLVQRLEHRADAPTASASGAGVPIQRDEMRPFAPPSFPAPVSSPGIAPEAAPVPGPDVAAAGPDDAPAPTATTSPEAATAVPAGSASGEAASDTSRTRPTLGDGVRQRTAVDASSAHRPQPAAGPSPIAAAGRPRRFGLGAPLQRAADGAAPAAPVLEPAATAAPRFTVDAPAGDPSDGDAGGAHRPAVTDPATMRPPGTRGGAAAPRRITEPAPRDVIPAPAATVDVPPAPPQLGLPEMAVQRAEVPDPADGPGPNAPTLGAPTLDAPTLDPRLPESHVHAASVHEGGFPATTAAVEPVPGPGALTRPTAQDPPPARVVGLGVVQRTAPAAPAAVGAAGASPRPAAEVFAAPPASAARSAADIALAAVAAPPFPAAVQRTSLVDLVDAAPPSTAAVQRTSLVDQTDAAWTPGGRGGDPPALAGLVGTRPLAAGPAADAPPAVRTPGNVAGVQRLPAVPPAEAVHRGVQRLGATALGAAASGATATVLGAPAVPPGGATASGAAVTVLRMTAGPATGATAPGTTYRTVQRTTFPTPAGSPAGAATSGPVTDPPAVPASVQRLLVAEAAARAAVQRDEETVADLAPTEAPPAEPAAEPAAPATETATAAAAPPGPAVPAPGPGGAATSTGGLTDVDTLVGKLYDPLVRRLKAELRLDRERAGHVLDLRQ